jgi:hypothetical protein
MTDHTKLNIGESAYAESKKFIDDIEMVFQRAYENASPPEDECICDSDCPMGEACECGKDCYAWKHWSGYEAIHNMRQNPIYIFHKNRTEMVVRPDNKKLTDKQKLELTTGKKVKKNKYMRCNRCSVVITCKEEKSHYKRKKCIETHKRRINNASITIQRWYRYWVHRRKYLKQQKKIMKKQKKLKKENKKIMKRSARKIQAICRGYIVRKNNLIRKDIVNNVVNTAIAYAIEQEEQGAEEPEPTIEEMLKKYENEYYEIDNIEVPNMAKLKKMFGAVAVQEKLDYLKLVSKQYNDIITARREWHPKYSKKINEVGNDEQKRQFNNYCGSLNDAQKRKTDAITRRLKAIHKL